MSAHQFDSYARQALDIAKNSLLVNLRFMNAAFSRLKPLPMSNATLATDGSYIRYDAQQLAQLYAHDPYVSSYGTSQRVYAPLPRCSQ